MNENEQEPSFQTFFDEKEEVYSILKTSFPTFEQTNAATTNSTQEPLIQNIHQQTNRLIIIVL